MRMVSIIATKKDGYRVLPERSPSPCNGVNIGWTSYLGWVKPKDALRTMSLDRHKDFCLVMLAHAEPGWDL